MNSQLLEVCFRSVVVIIVLFLIAKAMGKKQIAQLNLYDYIIGISIGSLAADISLDTSKKVVDGIISIVIYGGSAVIISFITMKGLGFRRIFSGTPSVLMEKGKIIEAGLKKVKFDVNDLMAEARNMGYFNLEEIEYAVMETNGKVSFMPKDMYKPVTKKDMNLKVTDESLTANVIIDEKIIINNLKAINKNKEWLLHELKVKGHKSLKGILLVTVDSNDKVIVYMKNEKSKEDTVLE